LPKAPEYRRSHAVRQEPPAGRHHRLGQPWPRAAHGGGRGFVVELGRSDHGRILAHGRRYRERDSVLL